MCVTHEGCREDVSGYETYITGSDSRQCEWCESTRPLVWCQCCVHSFNNAIQIHFFHLLFKHYTNIYVVPNVTGGAM